MIPLISSICQGPLQICQLPRFWWKVLLRQKGLLDKEYPDCSAGLDSRVLEAVGLDKDTTLDWLRDRLPNYLEFEDWALEQQGGELDREPIEAFNEMARTRIHRRPEKIEETYRDIGLPHDSGIDDAVILNSLQDWSLWHRRDLDSLEAPFVPTVSTIDYGPLGVVQLPRAWQKNIVAAKGILHPEYVGLTPTGLDAQALEPCGIDSQDALDFITDKLPTYLEFEQWVEANGEMDRAGVDDWNEKMRNRLHNDDYFNRITAALGRDPGTRSAVVLNHCDDWLCAYESVIEAI